MDPAAADAYLVAHLREALLNDGLLADQALDVVVVSVGRLAVRGEVATPERKAAAIELIRGLAGDTEIIDDLRVSTTRADREPETL